MNNNPSAEISGRVALFGNFGGTNLGNECTLSATIGGLAEHMPKKLLYGIGVDPAALTEMHGIEAVPIDASDLGVSASGKTTRPSLLVRVLRRLRFEWGETIRARATLKGTRSLLVVGTGILEDDTGSLGWFIAILRWGLAARSRGCFVGIVSVGAGLPPRPGLPRFLLRAILASAHYVSYRDICSRDTMRDIGVRVEDHKIFPDLAFSLPASIFPRTSRYDGGRLSVGLGTQGMSEAADRRVREDSRERYLEELARFSVNLIEHEDKVDFIYGDSTYDLQSAEELVRLTQSLLHDRDEATPKIRSVESFQDLIIILAEQDVVVSSRFHNIILAMMLEKPVIAFAYNVKHFDLMAQFGLERYAYDWLDLDSKTLSKDVEDIRRNWSETSEQIRRVIEDCRKELDLQYECLIKLMHGDSKRIESGSKT